MIRAVIDQDAFEKLVAGKTVKISGGASGTAGRIEQSFHVVEVELILSDIGFQAMIDAIRIAAGLQEHAQ